MAEPRCGQLSESIARSSKCLLRWADVQVLVTATLKVVVVPKRVAEEAQALLITTEADHFRLLAVDLETQTGLEYPLNPVLTLRGGYLYGKQDRDELTAQNEFVTNSATLGLGLTPAQASWSVQWGYAYEWLKADFGDPSGVRESRQRLAMQFMWSF